MLAKWEDNLPSNFYAPGDCWLWIHKNGKIYKRKRSGLIHAHIWGDEAWENQERGYYNKSFGLVYGYHVPLDVRRKLAKKFEDAIYYKDAYE